METIYNLLSGLPEYLMHETPLLQQYQINIRHGEQWGTRLYANGAIFTTELLPNNSRVTQNFRWLYFTHLKPEGLKHLQLLIANDFMNLKQKDMPDAGNAHTVLVWKASWQNQSNQLSVPSGLYENLPEVFRDIDQTINRFLYSASELPAHFLNENISD